MRGVRSTGCVWARTGPCSAMWRSMRCPWSGNSPRGRRVEHVMKVSMIPAAFAQWLHDYTANAASPRGVGRVAPTVTGPSADGWHSNTRGYPMSDDPYSPARLAQLELDLAAAQAALAQ